MNESYQRTQEEIARTLRESDAAQVLARIATADGEAGLPVIGEKALRELEASSSPVRIFDLATLRILAVNDAAVAFYGYSREEFLDMRVTDTRHSDEHEALKANVVEQVGYLRHRAARRHLTRSGEVKVVEVVTQDVLFNGRRARLSLVIDITGRLRMQELIWKRQQEFETLAEHSPDIVSRLDRDYRHLYVNSAITAATGRPPQEFVGRTVSEVGMAPELVATWHAVLARAFATGEEQELECRSTGPNGERDYECRIIPERGPTGGVETVLVITRDFTDRKKAENELRRQKDLFAAIIDNLPVGVFIRDAETLRYIARNRFLEESNGYRVDRSVGKTVRDLFPEEQAERSEATDRAALESGRMIEIPEQEMLGRSGEQRLFHVRKVPLLDEDGQPRLLVGIAHDITDRKRADQQLRETNEYLHRVIESSQDCIKVLDLDGRLLSISRGGQRLMELPDDSAVLGRIYAEFFGGEDRKTAEKMLRAARNGEAGRFEAYCPTAKGAPKWWDEIVTPMLDKHGQPQQLLVVSRDITEQKRSETALRESERQLAADLDAMTRLQRAGSLYLRGPGMEAVMSEILDAAIAIAGADMGNIQVLDAQTDSLRIVAQRGFDRSWLDYWDRVHRGQGTCGEVLARRERVIVEDINESPLFAGTPALQVQQAAGVRAVQSTPLVSRSGELLGVFSTHYKTSRRPDERALRLLDLLARQTADMIERERAESALAESETRFRQLAENIRQVFWITTPDLGKVVYISAAYEEIWGKSRESVYRHPKSWMDSIHPDDLPKVHTGADGMARGRALDVEYRIIRPDGKLRWIRDRSYPIRAGDGTPLMCGIAEDLTDLKLAEQEKLTHAVHQRDALVREVHHRIKNSLQGIVGLLRQKIRKYPAVAPDIEEAIGQLQSLALVYGLQETRPDGLLSLAEITDAICSSAEKLIGGRVSRKVERQFAQHACITGAEAVSVAVALNELVFNALKHQPAQAGKKRASVRIREGRDAAEICISNRGRLPKTFDFAQGRAVGYGLGLVRTLLAPPGGKIHFKRGQDKVEVKLTLAPPLLAERRKTHAE